MKALLIGIVLFLSLSACSGSNGENPFQKTDCLPNEIVLCLTEEWSDWYDWLDEYGYYEHVITDGVGISYDGYLLFEIGLRWRRLGGLVDNCHHATIYTMGRKIEGTEIWEWKDVDGMLSICDDMLSLSALYALDGQKITEPKGI